MMFVEMPQTMFSCMFLGNKIKKKLNHYVHGKAQDKIKVFHNKLPLDPFQQILSRLPVKSLMRFKCVCRSWSVFITSPNVIASHLNRSRQSNSCSILVKYLWEEESFLSLLSPHDLSVVNLNLDWLVFHKYIDFTVVGHSDGIICLSDYEDNIALCNPATKESLLLPQSRLRQHYFPFNPNLFSETDAMGFGLDPKNNYKVVRIVSYREIFTEGGFKSHPSKVEIYTLGGSSWREVKNAMDRIKVTSLRCTSIHTYFHGAFHWCATDNTNKQDVILSFDMSEERFRTIPTPDFLSPGSKYTRLKEWDGFLALVVYPMMTKLEKMFEIFVLNGYGSAKECWSKVLIVGPIAGVEAPLLFWGSDEILLESSDGGIMVYDRKTQKSKKILFGGEKETFTALTYISSLASIKA